MEDKQAVKLCYWAASRLARTLKMQEDEILGTVFIAYGKALKAYDAEKGAFSTLFYRSAYYAVLLLKAQGRTSKRHEQYRRTRQQVQEEYAHHNGHAPNDTELFELIGNGKYSDWARVGSLLADSCPTTEFIPQPEAGSTASIDWAEVQKILPTKVYNTVLAVYRDGKTKKDVCQLEGVSESTVSSRLRCAVQALKGVKREAFVVEV